MSVTDVKGRYPGGVTRWPPDARGRLEAAALELYVERGFDETTVAEIAASAGLTERTFFRYFADKREVLFGGSGVLAEMLAASVAGAPSDRRPMEVVTEALVSVAPLFEGRRKPVLRRQKVIDANPELQERELIKLDTLARAISAALGERGVAPGPARLAAEAGLAAFRLSFQIWVEESGRNDLAQLIREAAGELRALAGGQ